jgi:hypothetical protein
LIHGVSPFEFEVAFEHVGEGSKGAGAVLDEGSIVANESKESSKFGFVGGSGVFCYSFDFGGSWFDAFSIDDVA